MMMSLYNIIDDVYEVCHFISTLHRYSCSSTNRHGNIPNVERIIASFHQAFDICQIATCSEVIKIQPTSY